jgi:predicted nucleic acid-binding protein
VLVVDASFLMAVFVEEAHTRFAQSVLEAEADTPRVAPGLLAWEFGNILWKKQRRGHIEEVHLEGAREFLEALDVGLVDPPTPAEVADLIRLAANHGLTVYDAAYLSLALELSAPLATTDSSLGRAAQDAGVVVHSPFA